MAAFYTFEDLSGATTSSTAKSDNPYQDVIDACSNDASQIQSRYTLHRTNRNAQQRVKLLSPDFAGVTPDEILAKLENPQEFPGYEDPRHCLVFWARPTVAVRELIGEVQRRLREAAPSLWLMPSPDLHMTALEITHSLTSPEITTLVEKMLPSAQAIADYPSLPQHRARLVKPCVSFDAQALALSWVPAAGEPSTSSSTAAPKGDADEGAEGNENSDGYTYHHLRRDLFSLARQTGIEVASRYVIPSAHLTIGRFVTKADFEDGEGGVDGEKIRRFVKIIEGVNEWLEREYWPSTESKGIKEGGEWIVGQEKGLEFRRGALWYGSGGEKVLLGKGF